MGKDPGKKEIAAGGVLPRLLCSRQTMGLSLRVQYFRQRVRGACECVFFFSFGDVIHCVICDKSISQLGLARNSTGWIDPEPDNRV